MIVRFMVDANVSAEKVPAIAALLEEQAPALVQIGGVDERVDLVVSGRFVAAVPAKDEAHA